jgi:hypothetical protein
MTTKLDFSALAQKREPVAWIESPHGEIKANPLYKINAPQSLEWKIPLYTHRSCRETHQKPRA